MYTTEGIILKKQDVGEAGAVFTIYAKDFGKVRALAQGIKKEGAKLKGHLEPLSLSRISFVPGKNDVRLTHASLVNAWPLAQGSLVKLRAAWHIADLADRHCYEGERDEALWALISSSFSVLENNFFSEQEVEQFLRTYEKEFLACLGYAGEHDIGVLDL